MITILADHNIEGQAIRLWDTLLAEGWIDLFPVEIVMFADVGLAVNSNDRDVWRFTQAHRMVLLTNNRNMKGEDSLTQTLREENTLTSLPVITIGSLDRMDEESIEDSALLDSLKFYWI